MVKLIKSLFFIITSLILCSCLKSSIDSSKEAVSTSSPTFPIPPRESPQSDSNDFSGMNPGDVRVGTNGETIAACKNTIVLDNETGDILQCPSQKDIIIGAYTDIFSLPDTYPDYHERYSSFCPEGMSVSQIIDVICSETNPNYHQPIIECE